MTTALQIINRAAELILYKDPDESLSGNDSASFLDVLNGLVGDWNTKRMYIPATTTVSASVSASPVSVGDGQTLNTPRPVRIEGGWIRQGGIDCPIEKWLTSAEYDAIADKSATGTLPTQAYYQPSLPSGAIYLWPVPSASATLFIRVMSQLSEFADLATDYDLAPGYKRALEYSLAEELAPGRRPLDPQILRIATNARRSLKVANYEPVKLEGSDVAGRASFNIVTGQ